MRSETARGALALTAVFFLALAARLAYLRQIETVHYFDDPVIDALQYDVSARALLSGEDAYRAVPFYQSPGYPYFLCFVYKVFGPDRAAAHLAQMVVGALGCVLAALLGWKLFGRAEGLLGGALLAVYGPMIFYEGEFYREPLLAAALTLALLAWARAWGHPLPARWLGAGCALAACIALRDNFWIFIPFPAGYALWAHRGRAWKPLACFFLPVLAVLAFIAHKNHQASGRWSLLSSQGGLSFYMGNHRDMDRFTTLQPGIEYDQVSLRPLLEAGLVPAEEGSRWFFRQALQEIASHPLRWAGLLVKKAAIFLGGYEFMPNEDLEAYRSRSPLLRALLFRWGSFSFPFGVVGPLALLGFWVRRKDKAALWVTGAALLYFATILVFHSRARFRVPFLPVFCIFSAAALVHGYRQWRAGGVPLRLSAALAALLILCNAPFYDFSHAEKFPSNYYLAKHLDKAGRVEEALAAYRRAIADGIQLAEVHNDLSVLYGKLGRRDLAIAALEESVRLAPDYDKMRINLGVFYRDAGRAGKSREHLEKAIGANPYNPLSRVELGKTLERSDPEEALAQYKKAIELGKENPGTGIGLLREAKAGLGRLGAEVPADSTLVPEKQRQAFLEVQKKKWREVMDKADLSTREGRIQASDAYSNLGTAYLRLNELDKAEEAFLKSLSISYQQTPAHINLGIVYKKKGDLEKAVRHYKTALEIMPENYLALNNLGKIYEAQGDYAQAANLFSQAARLQPENPVIRQNLQNARKKAR